MTDLFEEIDETAEKVSYTSLLNPNGDGVMGYLEIPKIEVSLPIYHGTEAAVMERGNCLPILISWK